MGLSPFGTPAEYTPGALAVIFEFFPALFCYIAPGLLALVGVWHLVNPTGVWKLARLHSESAGLATADAPTPGGLRVVRIRGVFILLVAIGFAVFSHAFFSDWPARDEAPTPPKLEFPGR